jgi:hypothetical protein
MLRNFTVGIVLKLRVLWAGRILNADELFQANWNRVSKINRESQSSAVLLLAVMLESALAVLLNPLHEEFPQLSSRAAMHALLRTVSARMRLYCTITETNMSGRDQ